MAGEMLSAAREISDWMIDIRRKIHKQPELSFDCCKTRDLVKDILTELNVYYYTDNTYAETGVVGCIGSGSAPRVALRADMDALPLQELYEWDYKSEVDGAMHACGHDAHVAMLLGAAKLLQERYVKNELQGTVYLIFQPAEEKGGGAKFMVKDGALKEAEAIFGLHVSDAGLAGVWASKPDILMAGSGKFSAKINGKGGHGGRPQQAIDPVVASAYIITALQPIISRETDPADSQVITVGYIHGGEANNVIPDYVDIGGTFRHVETDKTKLEERKQRILEVIESQAKVQQCTAEPCQWEGPDYPPLVNGEDAFEFARGVALKVLQDESSVLTLTEPTTASEDFSYYLEQLPGAYAFIGCAAPFPEDGVVYGVHNPRFVLDEACLPYGAAINAALAIEYLANTPTLAPPSTATPTAPSPPKFANSHFLTAIV